MYLIAGLGNPGRRYADTRHNLGFLFLDFMCRKQQVPARFEPRLSFAYRELSLFGEDVVLIKPVTYMNRSGIAVRDALDLWDLPVDNLIVCYDDLDIPVGRIRIRERGSAGGHKGLAHILNVLGTDTFCRIRLGIGNPDAPQAADTVDYVLSPIPASEQELVEQAFEDAYNAVETILTEQDVQRAMQRHNRRN